MIGSITWYATRGAGFASLLLFTGVVALGLLVSLRWQRDGWPRFLTVKLHRSMSLLAVVFLAIHVLTAIVDPWTALGPIAALIPFSASYRPVWLGLGVVAVDLAVALVVTSLVRARLGFRAWRAIHWLAYAAWPLAMAHGVGAGTDTSSPWAMVVYAGCAAAVAGLLAMRVLAGSARTSARLPTTLPVATSPSEPAAGIALADALQFQADR